MNTMQRLFSQGYLLMILSVGFIWLRSSYGKIAGGTFVDALGETLAKFASKNPYLWYKSYLLTIAIPNARFIATLIIWTELFVALSIVISASYLLIKTERNKRAEIMLLAGLLGGTMLNLNFWLAAGWMSPSTDSINLLMLLLELIGVIYIVRLLQTPPKKPFA